MVGFIVKICVGDQCSKDYIHCYYAGVIVPTVSQCRQMMNVYVVKRYLASVKCVKMKVCHA